MKVTKELKDVRVKVSPEPQMAVIHKYFLLHLDP